MLAGKPSKLFSRAEEDRGGDPLARKACGSENDPFVFAFRQNDFAIALPCDIKKLLSKSMLLTA